VALRVHLIGKLALDGKMAIGAMPSTDTFLARVGNFVMGGSHIGTGGDRYLLANRPSEGSRASRRALDDPSGENIAHYLRVHIDDESLVTTSWWTTSTGRTPGHQSSSRRAGNRLACRTTTHKTSPKSRRPSS
jgi:hypothetical protein